MNNKIITLHPAGKKGVNISTAKYEQIKSYILNILSCHPELRYKELDAMANEDLYEVFEGSVSWYLITVKLDLEARGIIERKAGKGGHLLKLK